MVAQAGLQRFFNAAAPKAGGEVKAQPVAPTGSSPRTPTPRGGRGVAAEAEAAGLTPSSAAAGARKRGGRTPASSNPEPKRPRGATGPAAVGTAVGPDAGAAAENQGVCLPVSEDSAGTIEAPAAPEPAADRAADLDLRAALEKARRPDSKVPPFTAECLHHYNSGGAQYSWPEWLRPEHIRDAQGRRPAEPGYNGGTLWVPNEKVQKDSGHGTPMLLQFWKFKSAHFDKIALFKVGKFYELFYYDAFIAQRECGLKWMGEKKPHVGFPEMAKNNYAKMLVDAGYKVVVVEQVERVAEQKERVVAGGKDVAKTGPTCVERDLCEVFTKGTLVDPELLGGSGARYMAFLHFEDQVGSGASAELPFAACLVDAATSQIYVGRISDAPDRNALRTLLAQVQPSEVVYTVNNLPAEVLTILRRLPCRPQLSPLRAAPSAMAAKDKLARYRREQPGRLPEAVEALLGPESTAVAVVGAMEYLEGALLGRRVLPFAVWDVLDRVCSPSGTRDASGPSFGPSRMILDATALSALEVLETLEGTYKGSLLDFVDHTSTPFGFRLLKQWLCAPLCDAVEITKRQDCVEFLLQHTEIVQPLKEGLKKVPMDLERVTSRIWSYALQAERHAVMYEDITAKRLGDFMGLLKAYEHCLRLLEATLPTSRSLPERLACITRSKAQGGAFPELQAIITHLRGSVIDVTAPNGKPKFRPADGADANHDALARQIEQIKAKLETELQVLQSRHPNVTLSWIHRPPGERYEVECEHNTLPKSFLASVDVTSQSKAKMRFKTQLIKELVAELDSLEDRREDCIFPFLSRLFQEFHAHQAQFRAAVRCLSELDALLSMAQASRGLAGSACRAEIVAPQSPDAPGMLELRGCRHPVAAARMGSSFVPNDTTMNASEVPGVLVVTGPNMGGKSTVLRQTCIAAVMAQLGCRVNAEVCRLVPVDRIFTRIGSHDAILDGKSTLLTELEETAAVLLHATPRSMAVLDELGRGTSTFDGAAIAAAVLNELAENVRCMVMFATHYHPVSRQAAQSPKVAPFHMAAEVDPATNEMTFLYRFLPGLCPASHGHNVARLAGLPAKVLEEALARSAEFERWSSGPAPMEA